MIRSKRLPLNLLDTWLVNQEIAGGNSGYRLRVWRENRANLEEIRDAVIDYIDEAMDDARKRIRQGFDDNLSPFQSSQLDPAANYPALLHRSTLRGYFGETLAAIAVEHWGYNGQIDWVVPAFLFRTHDQEFQHLEEINQRLRAGQSYDPDQSSEIRPGRTGDDGLAFRISDEDVITDVLAIEAKCLNRSNNSEIEDACIKLSEGPICPTGVRELINLLDEYDTAEAQIWQRALLELWNDGYRTAARLDGIVYVCAQVPKRPKTRISWMPPSVPPAFYTASRTLEGLEFHLQDIDPLIDIFYRGA